MIYKLFNINVSFNFVIVYLRLKFCEFIDYIIYASYLNKKSI